MLVVSARRFLLRAAACEQAETQEQQGETGHVGTARLRVVEEGVRNDEDERHERTDPRALAYARTESAHEQDADETRKPVQPHQCERDLQALVAADEQRDERAQTTEGEPAEGPPEQMAKLPEGIIPDIRAA